VAALAAGCEVVVDRCNFDQSQRSTWIRLAGRFGARVLGLQLMPPIEECIRRAEARTDHPTLSGPVVGSVIQRYAMPVPQYKALFVGTASLSCMLQNNVSCVTVAKSVKG
jgi:predicted kinase